MVCRRYLPWSGGTERQAQKLAAQMKRMGVDVEVVTGHWKWGVPRREVIDGVPITRHFTLWGVFDIRGMRRLSGYLYMASLFFLLWRRRRRYDVLHVHMLNYHSYVPVLLGRWLGKPCLIKLASGGENGDIWSTKSNHLLPWSAFTYQRSTTADRLVAISTEIREELLAEGVPAERIVQIPNGVEVSQIPCKESYALDGTLTLTFIGRLHPVKGIDVLLEAFQKTVERKPDVDWRLSILGDGSLLEPLRALAVRLGIDSRVTFFGNVTDVSQQLLRSDVFVLPSRAEGQSNALLEGMSHALPCVATIVGGNPDSIKHDVSGLLVPVGGVEEMVAAFLRLGESEELRRTLGTNARRRVEELYALEQVAARYFELYRQLEHERE